MTTLAPLMADGSTDGPWCVECGEYLAWTNNIHRAGAWALEARCRCGDRTLRVERSRANAAGGPL